MIAGVADSQLDLALAVFGESPDRHPPRRAVPRRGSSAPMPARACRPLEGYLARPHVLVAASQDQRAAEVDAALALALGQARVALRHRIGRRRQQHWPAPTW